MQTDIIGTTIGIAGILFGYYLYRVGRRAKEPCWSIRSNNLIQNFGARLVGLKIQFGDQDVQNLTVSRILFWNAGGDTIRKSDIADANPLQIVACDGVALLEAQVLATSSQSNKVSCVPQSDKKSAILQFDYLDRDQGAVVQIVHTGTSSDHLKIAGDIMGAPLLLARRIERARFLALPTPQAFDEKFTPTARRRINATIAFGIGLGCLYFFGWMINLMRMSIGFRNFSWALVIIVAQVAFLGMAAYYQLQKALRTWRHGSPKINPAW